MAVCKNSLASEFIRLKIQLKQFANIELSPTELNIVGQGAEPVINKSINKSTNKSTNQKLHHLYQKFSLGALEQQLILLCLAAELDEECLPLLTLINQTQPYPTLELALVLLGQVLSESPGYDCLMPNNPLSLYKIIEVNINANGYLYSPLKLTPDILQYIISDDNADEHIFTTVLKPYCRPLSVIEPVLNSEKQSADQLQTILSHKQLPLLLCSSDQQINLPYQITALLAKTRAKTKKCKAFVIDLAWLPTKVEDLAIYCQAIIRELYLQSGLLLLQAETINQCDAIKQSVWAAWLEKLTLACPEQIVISAAQPLNFSGGNLSGVSVYPLPMNLPSSEEQQQLWKKELAQTIAQPHQWEQLTEHFCFNKQQITSVANELKLSSYFVKETEKKADKEAGPEVAPEVTPEVTKPIQNKQLWQACQLQQKGLLGELAVVIPPGSAKWKDIILLPAHKKTLKAVVAQVQQRKKVYKEWGFADEKSAYGLGISVLLSGSSGTGKTLAARIIANELQRDIYQIDLGQVADKYIGETEKNLEKVFTAAEHSGAILLFDEADALFGKRSKINDSKDRHANLGVSYLLQRMESYQGISILTSNFKSVFDEAFMRRIRFMVQFTFPDAEHRQKLWQQIFPAQAPKDNLDFSKLAKLPLSGGSIRNIVLQAAFEAASSEQPISMAHLLSACRHEYHKTEKTLSEQLVADW